MKKWLPLALDLLESSLLPVPQELNEIDWKLDISPNNKKLTQHLAAFANNPGGGYMAFGIDDADGTPVGISKEQAEVIISKLTNLSRHTLQPEPKIDYSIEPYKTASILIVHVPESAIKPVCTKTGGLEETYIRTGGSTRQASRHELANLLLNSKIFRFEELHASPVVSKEYVLENINYKFVLGLLERGHNIDQEQAIAWMEEEKMIEQVDDTGYYITNFGALAAATDLRKFDALYRKSARFIHYTGLGKDSGAHDITGQYGYAIGFSKLLDYIQARLPRKEFVNDYGLRETTTLYPLIALRELIANALVHQDFSITGKGPMIEAFTNRIEISNPGRLLASKKVDRLIGTNPESRNDLLASAMRRYKICEERGSGLIKVVKSLEDIGAPPLLFEEGENYFKVTIFAARGFSEMSPKERIDACYQHAIIRSISGVAMTNDSLRARLKLPSSYIETVSAVIEEAIAAKRIKVKGLEEKHPLAAEYVPYWA
jgi:ATP-dependent DNA helicase RecG